MILSTTLAVFLHIGLCFPLGYYYGATGAAISFAVPVTVLYLTMAVMVGIYHRKTTSLETGKL